MKLFIDSGNLRDIESLVPLGIIDGVTNAVFTATVIVSPAQALLAAKVGAAYVSPFVGRLDDIASDGMGLVRQIVEIFDQYEYSTEVLVASVRSPMHIIEASRMGADICTCPVSVIEACFNHPLTDIGLEKFLKDWEKAQAARV